MESGNYKIIEERLLSKEEILKGMDFDVALKKSTLAKTSLLTKGILIAASIVVATVAILVILNLNSKRPKPKLEKDQPVKEKQIKDSVVQEKQQVSEAREGKKEIKIPMKKDTAQAVVESKAKEVVEEYSDIPFLTPKSLPFKKRFNTDAESAITIKDSIYGPTNVSIGRGDYCEYNDPNLDKTIEKNSAWFKFTIRRDTVLTFHIVPTLKTDDYDFALFKCDEYSCMSEIKRAKLKPVRYSFAWNTTHNTNTGLSSNGRDTTWQNQTFYKNFTGKTYAPALKVKAGETYYLMVTISTIDTQNKDPEGFMIYFYRNLPKGRANTYNPKYGQ